MPYGYFPRRTNLGEQLGAGIAGFAENFRQAREGVRERRLQDEERQRQGAIQNYELAQRGVHLTGTTPLPSAVELGMAQDRASQGTAAIEANRRTLPSSGFQSIVRNAVNNAAGSGLQYTPSAVPEPDTRKAPGTFIDQLRESLVGPPPPKQDRFQVGPGYYVDTEEAAKNQEPAQYAARSNAFQQAITPALVQMMTRQDPADIHARERDYDIAHPLDNRDEKVRKRITELVAQGQPLPEANKQARLEFGETNTPSDLQFDLRKQNQVLTLQGHYNTDPAFRAAQDVAQAFAKIRSAATGQHTATSDMSVIYGMMKMQDPTSSVREGEYATAENAKGIPDYVRNLYNKAIEGTILTDHQRQQFLHTAESIARSQRDVFRGTYGRYADMAKRMDVNPQDVVFDPFDIPLGEYTPGQKGGGGGGGAGLPPLTPEQVQRAKTDPKYATFLKSKGYP